MQGDFVVLASEPVCIVGVDVSAPQQIRRGASEPISRLFQTFERQCSPTEVFGLFTPPQVQLKCRCVELSIAKHCLMSIF